MSSCVDGGGTGAGWYSAVMVVVVVVVVVVGVVLVVLVVDLKGSSKKIVIGLFKTESQSRTFTGYFFGSFQE